MTDRYRLLKCAQFARGILKRLLPPGVQRSLIGGRNAYAVVRREGMGCYLALRRMSIMAEPGSERTLHLRTLKSPFTLRAGAADFGEFVTTVMTGLFLPFLPEEADVIVDAGAYIGDSACWFLTQFPKAIVAAIEPDASNFSLLERNVQPYGSRCVLFKGAIWPRQARLHVEGTTANCLSVREVGQDEPSGCEGFTMPDVLQRMGSDRVDILKCNIEGGEEWLFSPSADEWMRRTSLIYVQVHNDRAREAVLSAAARNRFSCHVHRGFHILQADGTSGKLPEHPCGVAKTS